MNKSTIAIGLSAFFFIAVALAVFAQASATTVTVGQSTQATFGNYIISLRVIDDITNRALLDITNLQGQYLHYVSSSAGVTAAPAIINLGETQTLGLIDGTSLTIKVAALKLFPGLSRVTEATLEVSVPGQASAPSAPQNLAAQAGNGQVTLTWQAPADNGGAAITNFQIFRGTTSANKVSVATLGPFALTFIDPSLTNGQQVFYEITAGNSVGNSPRSNEVTATPTATTTSVTTTKTEITLNTGSLIILPGNDKLKLTSGVAGGVQVLVTDSNGNQLANQFLSPGQTLDLLSRGYTITVKTFSIFSTVTLEIATLPTLPVPVLIQRPTAPQNLAAQAASGQVTLTWQAPANTGGSAITNYRVFRGTTSANKALVTTVGNVLTFQDTGLTNGQQVFYEVSTVNLVGEGARSNEVTATPSAVNSPPSATITTPAGTQRGSITINYNLIDAESNTASVNVQFSIDNGATFSAATRGTAGDGIANLATSPAGTAHTFVWNSVADGVAATAVNSQVRIRITPSDTAAGTAVATNSFTVDNRNQPPAVSIFNPAAGAVFTAPASFTIEATATDPDGTVAKVEFFQGATKLGEDTTAPFTQAVANLAAGSYSFTAVATDNSGASTTSVAIGITVTTAPTAPSLFNLLNPATGSTIQTLIPTLTWADSTGETGYTVEVSTANTFATLVHSNATLPADSTSYNIPAGALAPSTTYFWRITARNTIGNTIAANGPFSFTTTATATANTAPAATVATPSGTQSGNIVISYQLMDAQSNTASVIVQYSIDNGATFATATSSGGDGIAGLITSPNTGTAHTFVWNSVADGVAATAVNSQVRIRITPSDTAAGTAVATNSFAVNNVGLPSSNPPSGSGGSSGGGSSGGGGGGGSASSYSATVVDRTVLSISTDVQQGKTVEFILPAGSPAALIIQKIVLSASRNVTAADATIGLLVLSNLPAVDDKNQILTALPRPDQRIVKIFQIAVSPALAQAIKEAKIEFTVTDSELAAANSLKVSETVLARFAGGKWEELDTVYLGKEGDKNMFSSTTPGFSVFVVTKRSSGVTQSASEIAAAQNATNATTQNATATAPSPTPSPTPSPAPISGLLISGDSAIAVYGIIAILFIALLYTVKKNRDLKKPEEAEAQEVEQPEPATMPEKEPKPADAPKPKTKTAKGVKKALDQDKTIRELSSGVQSQLSELQKELGNMRSSLAEEKG